MDRERYFGDRDDDELIITGRSDTHIRRAERTYPYLKSETTESGADQSLGVVGDLDQAGVEMFPQEGIVVGPDTNSDKAVRTFKDYADALFAIDDRGSIPISPEASESDPSEE